MTQRDIGLVVWMMVVLWGCGQAPDSNRSEMHIFAAASLTDVMEELVDGFESIYPGVDVHLHIAASSVLARQIEAGAPADLFLSADTEWVDYLNSLELVRQTADLASNTLVWIQKRPTNRGVSDSTFLALADPLHVPAGRYARQALECLAMWKTSEDNILPALDVRAALASVTNGYASQGIVYASDVWHQSQSVEVTPIADDCQPNIRYTLAQVKDVGVDSLAAVFTAFVLDPRKNSVWAKFGFIPCGGEQNLC